jgi:signal transduction histidine kinase
VGSLLLVPPGVVLAEAIANDKDAVLRCWRERVHGIDPSAAPESVIIDTLPAFLDELIAVLRDLRASQAPSRHGMNLALTHGAERFHSGFSLGAVIREYGIFRECLLDFIRERRLPLSMEELTAICSLMDSAIANAAEQFTRERDQLIEQQNERHFGFVAHELRNPLGSALVTAQMLQRRAGGQTDVAFNRLLRNLSTLRHRIDNSLIGVRIRELGRSRSVQTARVDLRELAEAVREDLAGDADERQIRIEIEGSATTEADARLIQSALGNLVGNAVKYTKPGSVIHVRLSSTPELASVEIADQCGGLPDGKAEELFVPFVQRSDDRSGFGLGLAITKDAIEAHHGTIQVVNRPGQGCTFMISLPRAGVTGT